MAMLNYFQPAASVLPKPDGPLSRVIPAYSIAAANKEVKRVLDLPTAAEEKQTTSKRGTYNHFTPEEKARIGKRAAEHSVTATIRYFSKVFPDCLLKESTVRTWKKKFLQETARKKRAGEDMTVKEIADKKRGRPLLLGCKFDKQVQAYLIPLRENGAVILL